MSADDYTVDKIRNMWMAHNDGVYLLSTRSPQQLGDMIEHLLNVIDEKAPSNEKNLSQCGTAKAKEANEGSAA